MAETTMIRPCNCKHNWQDQAYGQGNRVHNKAVKRETWRCTVCKTEKGTPKK